MSELRKLFEDGILTDIIVRSGNTDFKAHRCVLAASSEYFKASLTSSMKESEKDGVIILKNIDEEYLGSILKYIYSGKIIVQGANVIPLLDAANQLELEQLIRECCQFLQSNLDVENCLGVHAHADQYFCSELSREAETYIFRYFEAIVTTSAEFLDLPFDRLRLYFGRDELTVSNEEVLFKAMVRWVNHDPSSRRMHVPDLIQMIRLELVSIQFIAQEIHECNYVKDCPTSLSYILSAYRWHSLPESKRSTPRKMILRNKAVRKCLYVIGGDDGFDDQSPFNDVSYFESELGEWITVAPLLRPRSVCATACWPSGQIVVVGGYDGEKAMDSVEEFDIRTNVWSPLPSLRHRRGSCNCVILQDILYVVGGICGSFALSSMERYDRKTRTWSLCADMLEARSACGVAVLPHPKPLIYVVGGINSYGNTVATAEVFDPDTNTWRPAPAMNCPRRSFGLAAVGSVLVAAGGSNGTCDLSSCEVFDPVTESWRFGASMLKSRMYCTVAAIPGGLFAVGETR